MGLDNREAGKFITIYNGKFSIRVSPETPGAIARVNKLGNTVHEKYYDSFTGKLVGIRTREGNFGKEWIFDFQDGGDVYHLQLSYSNSYASKFLKMLPNVDLNKEMKVQPAVKVEDGKNKSSLFISQDGVTLKQAYTRTNPNGLPDLEPITVKGVQVLDDTKQLAFLAAMVERDIIPKLPKAVTTATASEVESGLALENEPVDQEAEEDDF